MAQSKNIFFPHLKNSKKVKRKVKYISLIINRKGEQRKENDTYFEDIDAISNLQH
jgi:hypothetical protein